MQRLIAFENMTLDGFFAGPGGDLGWAYKDPTDAEWNEFVAGNAKGGGTLLFGRVTYELMAAHWPTPAAAENNPVVARRMNAGRKVVFSRTLDAASWDNTRLVKSDLASEVRKMKSEPGEGMAILGSGSLVSQLAQEGLIDEFQIVVHPVVIGRGKALFGGIRTKLVLRLVRTRAFGNGSVLLCYAPAEL